MQICRVDMWRGDAAWSGGGWDPKLGRCVGIAYVEGRKIDMVKQAGSQEDTEKCICLESSGTQLCE